MGMPRHSGRSAKWHSCQPFPREALQLQPSSSCSRSPEDILLGVSALCTGSVSVPAPLALVAFAVMRLALAVLMEDTSCNTKYAHVSEPSSNARSRSIAEQATNA